MKHKTEKIELRVMELEDTVALLSRIIHTMSQMLGNLNKITAEQTDMISKIVAIPSSNNVVSWFRDQLLPCPSPNPEDCASCATDNDAVWCSGH